ncbi:MAG TPA: cobalamin-binding protein [Longimicrobiales bacterium]
MVDDAGRPIGVARPVRRIISVSPSATELLVALGAADRLITRTDYDTDPRLARLPSLGPTTSPDAEAVFALRPELVIAPRDVGPRTLVARLDALGVPVYVADVQRVADIFSTTRRLGALVGLADRADSLVATLRAGFEAVRRAYRSSRRPTVFYVVWHDPPQTTGPGTFIDEVISAAGARNVFADVGLPWPQVSLEALVHRDPDYIVLPVGTTHTTTPARLGTLPGWRELTAVREGRIIVVESDLFNRPGPRFVEAARTLGRALHAGATAGVAP